jgi:hypothetical protein
MKKKFRYEAASDSGAAFIFCEYNPVMKAKIIEFRSHKEMDQYNTHNITVQIKKQLPILLEVVETEATDKALILKNITRMAEWYYYSLLK